MAAPYLDSNGSPYNIPRALLELVAAACQHKPAIVVRNPSGFTPPAYHDSPLPATTGPTQPTDRDLYVATSPSALAVTVDVPTPGAAVTVATAAPPVSTPAPDTGWADALDDRSQPTTPVPDESNTSTEAEDSDAPVTMDGATDSLGAFGDPVLLPPPTDAIGPGPELTLDELLAIDVDAVVTDPASHNPMGLLPMLIAVDPAVGDIPVTFASGDDQALRLALFGAVDVHTVVTVRAREYEHNGTYCYVGHWSYVGDFPDECCTVTLYHGDTGDGVVPPPEQSKWPRMGSSIGRAVTGNPQERMQLYEYESKHRVIAIEIARDGVQRNLPTSTPFVSLVCVAATPGMTSITMVNCGTTILLGTDVSCVGLDYDGSDWTPLQEKELRVTAAQWSIHATNTGVVSHTQPISPTPNLGMFWLEQLNAACASYAVVVPEAYECARSLCETTARYLGGRDVIGRFNTLPARPMTTMHLLIDELTEACQLSEMYIVMYTVALEEDSNEYTYYYSNTSNVTIPAHSVVVILDGGQTETTPDADVPPFQPFTLTCMVAPPDNPTMMTTSTDGVVGYTGGDAYADRCIIRCIQQYTGRPVPMWLQYAACGSWTMDNYSPDNTSAAMVLSDIPLEQRSAALHEWYKANYGVVATADDPLASNGITLGLHTCWREMQACAEAVAEPSNPLGSKGSPDSGAGSDKEYMPSPDGSESSDDGSPPPSPAEIVRREAAEQATTKANLEPVLRRQLVQHITQSQQQPDKRLRSASTQRNGYINTWVASMATYATGGKWRVTTKRGLETRVLEEVPAARAARRATRYKDPDAMEGARAALHQQTVFTTEDVASLSLVLLLYNITNNTRDMMRLQAEADAPMTFNTRIQNILQQCIGGCNVVGSRHAYLLAPALLEAWVGVGPATAFSCIASVILSGTLDQWPIPNPDSIVGRLYNWKHGVDNLKPGTTDVIPAPAHLQEALLATEADSAAVPAGSERRTTLSGKAVAPTKAKRPKRAVVFDGWPEGHATPDNYDVVFTAAFCAAAGVTIPPLR